MKELDLLQDICLSLYGISLADISLETFEHLDAVVWSMSKVRRALLDDTKVFDKMAVLDNECPCCDESFDGCSCDNCGFEDIHVEREIGDDLKERADKFVKSLAVCDCCDSLYISDKHCCCPHCNYEELPF